MASRGTERARRAGQCRSVLTGTLLLVSFTALSRCSPEGSSPSSNAGGAADCAAASCPEGAPDAGAGPPTGESADAAGPASSIVSALGAQPVCAERVRGGRPPPTALHLMLDSSGSMSEEGSAGRTKWQELELALQQFMAESSGAGLDVGLQFFPLLKPGASYFCTSHEDCGPMGGPCFLSTCLNGLELTLCQTDADCPGEPGTNPCVDFGLCSGGDPLAPTACVLGMSCGDGLGACEEFERTCTNSLECSTGPYAEAAVEIEPLETSWLSIQPAMAARPIQGLSPLAPALRGALDHAAAWADARPEESVAVVLMTDGLSTGCEEPSLESVLERVRAAAGRVRTFVIGTREAATVATEGPASGLAGLNAIAEAGGTERALLVDTGEGLGERWAATLERLSALDCRVPLPSAGDPDFRSAETLLEGGAAPGVLEFVANAAGCERSARGWFYDTDPRLARPTAIELCPAACRDLHASSDFTLRVRIGCGTAAPPPNGPPGDPPGCNEGQLSPTHQTPRLHLLVDQSGSMTQPFGAVERWQALVEALTADGSPLRRYDAELQLEATLYTSNGGIGAGATPRECPILTRPGTGTGFPALEALLAGAAPAGDSPAAESIEAVSTELAAGPSGQRSILWLLDGGSDTCADANSDGTDENHALTRTALTASRERGIPSQLISIGSDLEPERLAELATAGARLGHPSAGFPTTDAAGLALALESAVDAVRCQVAIDALPVADASRAIVVLGAGRLERGAENGWDLRDATTLHLRGSACDRWQTGTEALTLTIACANP
jgi:hypothetical protein